MCPCGAYAHEGRWCERPNCFWQKASDVSKRAQHVTGVRMPDRWMAEITYRDGSAPTLHRFEEIEDLDELIERGRDWNDIDQITITLNRPALVTGK